MLFNYLKYTAFCRVLNKVKFSSTAPEYAGVVQFFWSLFIKIADRLYIKFSTFLFYDSVTVDFYRDFICHPVILSFS